ncbi:MAG: DUF4349 domain-containing protein [Lachnospiraceae bacterium]|nr:DUF4349 domain-containing protein [Lachnospiraceae bacterium]
MKRKSVKALAVFILAGSLLSGCGAADKSASMMSDTAAVNTSAAYDGGSGGIAYDSYAMSDEAYATQEAAAGSADASENQTQDMDSMTLLEEKLVYHCDLEIETLDYSGTMTSVKDMITKYGGVIQSENESDSGYNWYYEDYRKTSGTLHNYLQVRIPSANYDSFLAELDGVGKIISKSTSVDNISQQYYDTTTQIEALQIQERNLLSMLEQCETIEDMITVQERLSEVQYELNSLQTSKRYMDMDVAYSYVNINISEVMEYRYDSEPIKTNTFMDRLGNTIKSTGKGFLSFLEGLLFLVIRLVPYLLIAAVICFIFRKKIKRAITDRKAEKAAMRARRDLQRQAAMNQMNANQANMSQTDRNQANMSQTDRNQANMNQTSASQFKPQEEKQEQ